MKNITQKITCLVALVLSVSIYAQTTNLTGLPGDDLIFYEDMRYLNASGPSGFIVTVTEATLAPSGNSSIPADGLLAGEVGFVRPDNNYPAGDAIDNRSLRIQANDGSANYDADVWIVVNPVDLSAYDAGSKYFTFSTRTTFREDGGTNLDTDTSVLYTTNFVIGTDPTTVTWTPITTTPVGDSADMGADGVWTTQTVDLSGITCGSQFAIAVRRQSSDNGPSGGAFDSNTNRNGTFNMSDLVYTGSTTTLSVDEEKLLAEAVSVYPNPAREVLNISNSNANIKSVEIIDVMGKSIYSSGFKNTIEVGGVSRGLYILRLESQQGDVLTKKVVIK